MRQKLLLTLALLLTAATGAWADGSCGGGLTWTLNSGTLTISKTGEGTGAMTNSDLQNVPWYNERNNITSVVIGDGVTAIGQYAFYYCSNLASLTIGSSLQTIGVYAFYGCSKLASVNLPASVTNIGSSAFYECSNLSSVVIHATSVPTCGNNAFGKYKSGRKIFVPAASAESYGSGWSAYAADIIGYNGTCGATGNESDVVYALTGESPNRTLYISGTGAMTGYDWDGQPWYSQKDAITSVVIGDGVTGIGKYAFHECSNLASVTIGNSLQTIGEWAFKNCSMASITLPATMTTIGSNAFYECSNLSTVIIKATSLTGGYGGDAFVGNKSGRKIYVPANSANTYKAGWPAYANDIIGCGTCGATGHEWDVIWTLTGESPNCTLNIMKVGETGAMADYSNGDAKPWNGNRTNIKTIIVGDGVTHIGNHAFDYCAQTSLTIGSDVTTIGDCAFHNCGNITSIVIPNSVETIGESAFEYLSSLTNVTIGSGLKSIGAKGFHYNSQLSSVVIRAASLTSYGEVFDAGKNGRKIYVPAASVDTYKAGWTTYANDIIGYNGTCGATGHEWDVVWAVTGESPNRTLYISGTGAMADYDWNTMPWYSQKNEITSVVIGDGVTGIGKYAFYEHSTLASVTIGNSLETIGVWAFKNCSMTSVTFPASVKSIGNSSFLECNSLTSVTLNSNPQIQLNAFPDAATVTMNLAANPVDGDYWMTFFNNGYHFKADENTTVYKGTLSGSSILLKPVEDKIVTAGTAVILKSTGNPVMTLTPTASSDTNANNLQGVSDLGGVESDGSIYVLNKGSNGVGFYKLKSGKKIGFGKAYLSGSNAPSYLNFDESETTSINAIDNGQLTMDVYYDLQGRRVAHPTKGMYIVNGKKVIIK